MDLPKPIELIWLLVAAACGHVGNALALSTYPQALGS
jgi:hypothetical protein